jgi:hypothetical protein
MELKDLCGLTEIAGDIPHVIKNLRDLIPLDILVQPIRAD